MALGSYVASAHPEEEVQGLWSPLQGKAPVPSLHLTCKASSETADRLRKALKWLQQESTRADDKRKGYSFTRELVGTKGYTLS